MKSHLFTLALLAAVPIAFSAEIEGATQRLALCLQFPTNAFVAGQPVPATVVLQNGTTNAMPVPFASRSSIQLFILNQRKEPLSPTNTSIWHTYSGPSSVLLPGKVRKEFCYDLRTIFDLGAPGKYYAFATAVRFRGHWEKLPQLRSATNEFLVLAPR